MAADPIDMARTLNPDFTMADAELFATTLLALDLELCQRDAHNEVTTALMASLLYGLRAIGVDTNSVIQLFKQRIEMGGRPS